MIDLHRVAGFHLVATSGGYAKAARAAAYPITQPALHQQVKKLEAEVGTKLLERFGRDQMRPTPAGAHLLAFAGPFLRDLPSVVRALRAGEFAGSLSIQAESLLIRQLLPGWLMALRRRQPRVQLHLQEIATPDLAAVRSGQVDVLVAHLPEVHDDVHVRTIAELHPFGIAPREARHRRRQPQLAHYRTMTFLAYPVGSRQYALQRQALQEHDLVPEHTMHVDTADTILGFVESGLGWSLVPSLDPKGPVSRRLVAFPLERPKVTFPVVMAWRKSAPSNPVFEALLACAPSLP